MEIADLDVPVVVDDIKKFRNFDMTRFTFFSVACDEPAPGWSLRLGQIELPFLMLGLSGIVLSPPGGHTHFIEPADFDSLVKTIEQHEHLYVDINDMWLPNAIVANEHAARGNVFRVGQDLFASAFAFRNELMPDREFNEIAMRQSGRIAFSEQESNAFRQWSKNQITAARSKYKQREELALEYGEDSAWPAKEE